MSKFQFQLPTIFALVAVAAIGSFFLAIVVRARSVGTRGDLGVTEEHILREFEVAGFAVVEKFT